MNVLVVDNNVPALLTIVGLIRGWGYKAEMSETGGETLDKIRKGSFDLVLMDVSVPDMSVQELIRGIKELDPRLGIVTMTEKSTEELERGIRTLGIIYYMSKPVSEAHLKEILDHISIRISVHTE